jgi:drug/metabolite transporter (DMT)-like permease
MAASSILFALMNVFARLASSSTNWSTVGAVRAFIGAGVALAVARLRGTSLAITDRRALVWRSVFGIAATMSTFYVLSSRSLALGDAVTLFNLAPVFLSMLAPIVLRERTSGATVIAIAISLAGVVLVVRPSFLFHEEATATPASPTVAIVVAVLAAFFTAIAMMMLRRIGQRESAEAVAFSYSLSVAATMTLVALLLDPRLPSPRDAGYCILAGVLGGFGQLTLTRAYTLEAAARVGGMGYLSVVVSALLGAVALEERPTPLAIAGMGLVIAGGVVLTFVRPKPT